MEDVGIDYLEDLVEFSEDEEYQPFGKYLMGLGIKPGHIQYLTVSVTSTLLRAKSINALF